MSTAPLGPPSSTPHLKFLLSSSAENLIRLESLLERRKLRGSSPEFNAIIAAMLDRCARYRAYYLQHASLIAKVLKDEPINRIEDIGLKTLLRNCINTFLVLHELLLFLPRESIRRELNFFCDELFRPKYDPADLSIILTSVYNAFEYSLDAAIRSLDVYMLKVPDTTKVNFGHVMELAIIDRDNPLSWALLAHEFGHYLDQKNGTSARLTEEFIDNEIKPPVATRHEFQKLFAPLASELFADLCAYFLLGPVCILPIVNMELNFGMTTDKPLPYDRIHPFTSTRLQVISEAAAADHMTTELFSAYTKALKEDENAKTDNLSADERAKRNTISQYTIFFAQRLRSPILSVLNGLGLAKFQSENLAVANRIQGTLNEGVPIGSKRDISDQQLTEELDYVSGVKTVAECRRVFDLFKETPVRVSEVITAGWIANSESKVSWFSNAFSLTNPDHIFPAIRLALETQDDLLMKSIEIISVMRECDDATK